MTNRSATGRGSGVAFNSNMGNAVMALICFPPVGIVALIFASQAKTKALAGDRLGAEAAAHTAKTLGFIGFVLFLLSIAAMVLLHS